MLAAVVRDNLAQVGAFCRANRVHELLIFGSAVRAGFGAASDVDALVRFQPGERVGLLRMARMERQLSELLGGTAVDLLTPDEIHPVLRDKVMGERVVVYSDVLDEANRRCPVGATLSTCLTGDVLRNGTCGTMRGKGGGSGE